MNLVHASIVTTSTKPVTELVAGDVVQTNGDFMFPVVKVTNKQFFPDHALITVSLGNTTTQFSRPWASLATVKA